MKENETEITEEERTHLQPLGKFDMLLQNDIQIKDDDYTSYRINIAFTNVIYSHLANQMETYCPNGSDVQSSAKSSLMKCSYDAHHDEGKRRMRENLSI